MGLEQNHSRVLDRGCPSEVLTYQHCLRFLQQPPSTLSVPASLEAHVGEFLSLFNGVALPTRVLTWQEEMLLI